MHALRLFVLAAAVASGGFASSASASSWNATPSVAIVHGRVMVAWTAGGFVQTATQSADGSFPRGVAVGRAFRGFPPRLTVTPAGDQMLTWPSERGLRSAFRRAGQRVWELAAVGPPTASQRHVVMDSSGRAVAAWAGFTQDGGGPEALWVSTRPRGGQWSTPSVLDGSASVSSLSLAVDGTDDVVVEYGSGAGVKAVVLEGGRSDWDAPVAISAGDDPRQLLEVTGGSGRTFIARWNAIDGANPPAGKQEIISIPREARLTLPGTWSAPRDVVPASYDDPVGYALGSDNATAIDQSGNATAVWQFKIGDPQYPSYALGVAQLAADADTWTPPATLDMPAQETWTDSSPSLALDASGTATVAFVRGGGNDFQLVVATALGPFAALQGQTVRVASLPTRSPCKTLICAREWKVDPTLAVGDGMSAIAVQSRKQEVLVLTRAAADGPWTRPVKLRSAGRTTTFLLSRRVQNGVVAVSSTCVLPPCQGVVKVVEASTDAIFGSLHFSFHAIGAKPGTIVVPAWAMRRMRRGEHIRIKLIYDVAEGDGTNEHQLLFAPLHVARGD